VIRVKKSLDNKKIRRLIWLVLTVSVLLGYSLQSVAGSAYYSNEMQNYATVSSPPVILEEGNCSGTSTIYTNNTSAKVNVEAPLFDYVDNNDPDVDSSSDKGTHSNFPAQQAGPDSTYDTLAEENTEAIEDHVDNISDVDNSPDVGTHSNFENQKAQDSSYDPLTEASQENTYSLDATGGYMIIGDGTPDWGSSTGTISFWVKMDNSVQGRFYGQNGDMETRWSGTNLVLDWGATTSMTSVYSFSADTWYFVAIVWDENKDNLFLYVGDENNAPTLDANSLSGTWTSTTPAPTENRFLNGLGGSEPVDGHGDDLRYWNIARNLTEIQSDYNQTLSGSEPNLQSYFKLDDNFADSGPNNNDGTGSPTYSFSSDVPFSGSSDYGLDLEVQWTNVIDFLPTEKLCIYTGALGSEDLRVDYWNGTGWESLATDLIAYSCNYYAVSLTSTTFTIRFKDGTTEGDTTQDQWQIDASLLRIEGTGNKEDAVDQQSNVDGSADIGTHSNFTALKYKDLIIDTLTEGNTGGATNTTLLNDGFEGADWDANWDDNGVSLWYRSSTYHSGSYSARADDDQDGDFVSDDFNASGAIAIYVDFWFRKDDIEDTDFTLYYYNGSVYNLVDELDDNGGDDAWLHYTQKVTDSQYFVSNFRIRFGATLDYSYFYDENVWVDDVLVKKETQSDDNYELDLEVQWTDVPYLLPNEELCIYAGTMGTEDIKVDVWNGSAWINVISDMNASAWNNVTITSHLTSSTFTIRFKGGTETGDPSQDTWQIDVALIHIWDEGGEDYQLDLEVQWTGADYTQTNEELCIKTGTFSGSENIQVKVWNNTGSSWHWVMNLTASQWNNVSITSYLTSSTFTVQFLGGTETGDTTQDSWNIDATLLHVWTNIQAPTSWLNGWDERVKITIDNNDVDNPLSNFPVLVHLSNSSGRNNDDTTFVFDEVGSNSKKIAVTTTDETQCYVEIERWDAVSEEAWMWVKVPSISNTIDTELYLYYDMDHANNTIYVGDTGSTAAQNVWDSNFKGVWHLSETSGGVGAIKDSTSNNNVGTDNGSPTFNTTGRIDSAISFDGIDDYINMSNSGSLQFTSSLTIEAWINLESFGSGSDVDIVLRKGDANPNDYQLAIHDQKLALMIEENDDAGLESTANLTATTWYYLAGTWNGSTRRVYLNGSEDGSGPKTGNIIPDTRDIYIGGRSGTDLSTGVIDEVRASNTTRSAAWIKASYESGRDDLLGFGSEETCGRAEEYDFVLQVANQVANNWTINLQVYDSSNLARLSKATISFHDGNSSDQIIVSDGAITQSEGPPYDLGGNATIYISMSNLEATTNDLSYLYVHLKIQVPDTSTYMLYLITFEIT